MPTAGRQSNAERSASEHSQAELLATLIARLLEGRSEKVAMIESPRVQGIVDSLSAQALQVRVEHLR